MSFFTDRVEVKVPQVTMYFWIIKVLATTVGETFADFLNSNLGLGLSATSLIMLAILLASLGAQMYLDFYFAPLYWFVIVAISTVGTLLSDNLTDNLGVPLEVTTPIFFVLLMIVFFAWYRVEKSLSIHYIFTRRREAWYWLAVLVTFALGTSGGDLVAEKLNAGFGNSLLLFAAAIIIVALLWRFQQIDGVLGFWIVYVLTRPLGASMGDLLSQNPADSVDTSSSSGSGSAAASAVGSGSSTDALPSGWTAGYNLGTTLTSVIFLSVIAVLVVFLTVTKKDALSVSELPKDELEHEHPHSAAHSSTADFAIAITDDNPRR